MIEFAEDPPPAKDRFAPELQGMLLRYLQRIVRIRTALPADVTITEGGNLNQRSAISIRITDIVGRLIALKLVEHRIPQVNLDPGASLELSLEGIQEIQPITHMENPAAIEISVLQEDTGKWLKLHESADWKSTLESGRIER